ncbi:hypothetical protein MTR67_044247, partial [Solanum verrucosum]
QNTARAGGPWFTTATPPQPSSEKSPKSQLTDRPTVRRSDNDPWSKSVDQDLLYQASDTNYGRPARTVIRYTVRSEALSGRLDRRFQSTDRRLIDDPSVTPTAVNSGVFWSFPISFYPLDTKLESREEKKVKNPSSKTQQGSISSTPEIERFLRGIRHQVCGILLVGSFRPLGP